MDVAKELVLSKDQLVEWRRHFHKYPELSFQEEKHHSLYSTYFGKSHV